MEDEYFTKINKAFFELKEIFHDHEKIAEYFNISKEQYKEINNLLKISFENGYIEARETLLKKILAILDEVKFKAITPNQIKELLDYSTNLLFITVIVRKIFSGDIILDEQKYLKYDDVKDFDLKLIVSDISILAKEHDELNENRNYKEISTKLKQYNLELQKIQEISKNIAEEKKILFIQNAKNNLNEILTSIKKNYQLILQYINNKEKKIKDEENLLLKLNFKSILSTIKDQLSNFSKLRASFIFIIDEKYNIQQIVEKLYKNFNNFFKSLHNEEKLLLALLIKNKINSIHLDKLIFSIRDMIVRIINEKYIKEDS